MYPISTTSCHGCDASTLLPGIGRSFNGSDVAPDKDRNVTGTDVFLSDKLYISSLDHCVRSFYCSYKAFCLDHSESF
jgi:hypothetical protein